MLPRCESVVTASSCLYTFITASCIITFVCTIVTGVLLILAPEEPSLNLGGGTYYSLVPGVILLVIAICTVILGVFGFTSVVNDNKCQLQLYTMFGFVVAVCILICVTVLFSFTYGGVIENNLNTTLWSHIQLAVPDSNDSIFDVQSKYRCCGVDGPRDWCNTVTKWYQVYYNECNHTPIPLPESCYSQDNKYQQGCKYKLLKRLELLVNLSFGIAIIASILQMFTSSLTYYGNRIIKKYENYTAI